MDTTTENQANGLLSEQPAPNHRSRKALAFVSLALVAGAAVVSFVTLRPKSTTLHPRSGVIELDVIVDDADDQRVQGRNWVNAQPGDVPFATKWFGSLGSKGFHHDNAANKGAASARFTPTLPQNGCYEVFEWHATPAQGMSASNMPRSVPFTVRHCFCTSECVVDQSVRGGQWNRIGTFPFHAEAIDQHVTSSNAGTDDCEHKGACYWIVDALKFKYTGLPMDSCVSIDPLAKPASEQLEEAGAIGQKSVSSTSFTTKPTDTAVSTRACGEHIVVNDGAPTVNGDGWTQGRVGEKPYFDEWFGDLWSKDFHHDAAAMPKGTVHATYTPELPRPGCYTVQEWHLGGSRWCFNYMPKSVPVLVVHADGETLHHIDQSVNGGQWNGLGAFQLVPGSHVKISNNGTDNCVYQGHCYTVFDSFRFVYLGDSCSTIDAHNAASLADNACNSYGLQQQPLRARQASASSELERLPMLAEHSDTPLVHIDAPTAEHVADAGGPLTIVWSVEGLPRTHGIKLDLHNGFEHIAVLAQAHAADGSATVTLPSNDELSRISSRPRGNRFKIRIEAEHTATELNSGFLRDQLVAESEEFRIN